MTVRLCLCMTTGCTIDMVTHSTHNHTHSSNNYSNFVLFFNLRITHNCHDDASRFVRLMATNGCNYLVEEDFMPLVQVRRLWVHLPSWCDVSWYKWRIILVCGYSDNRWYHLNILYCLLIGNLNHAFHVYTCMLIVILSDCYHDRDLYVQ